MTPWIKRLPARFYRSDTWREPVREWVKQLSAADRRIIGEDNKDVEFSWPIGMPLVRALGRDLWEVRSHLTSGKIARVLFWVEAGSMVVLHGFIKKSQRTPQRRGKLRRHQACARSPGRAAMREQGLSKAEMARCMQTSRAALNRLLDPDNGSVTLATLQKAAAVIGGEVRLELV